MCFLISTKNNKKKTLTADTSVYKARRQYITELKLKFLSFKGLEFNMDYFKSSSVNSFFEFIPCT